MTDRVYVRRCCKAEKEERDIAVYDYYITNRLIAYGKVPDTVTKDLPPEVREEVIRQRIEDFCLKLYKKDMERIRRKYESTDSKS